MRITDIEPLIRTINMCSLNVVLVTVRSKVLILTVEKTANYHLPPPEPMVCTGDVMTNWRIFEEVFADYSTATELAKKYAEVQAATLKMVMEKSADKYFRVWSSLKPKRKTRLQFWTSYRSISCAH